MQNISGNMSQSVRQDLGEFVTILGEVRIRKELIYAYLVGGPITNKEKDHEYEGMYSVNYMMPGGWNSSSPHTKEKCELEVQRLDWIYKKDMNENSSNSAE